MGINKSDDQVAHEKYSIINIIGIIATIIMMMVTCTLPQPGELEQSGQSPLAESPSAPGSPDHNHYKGEYHDED